MKAANRNLPAVWTTKEGQVIPIREMSTSHLVNTISYLRRHYAIPRERLAWHAVGMATAYASEAPDGAALAVESDMDWWMTEEGMDYLWEKENPTFGELMKEAKRRKIRLYRRAQ